MEKKQTQPSKKTSKTAITKLEVASADTWYEKAIRFLLYSMAAIVPMIFSTSFYSVFAETKVLALRTITLAILFLWAWKSFVEEKFNVRRGAFCWFLLAYTVILILTTITSTHIFSSLFGAETRFLGVFTQLNFLLIAFLVFNFLRGKKELKIFLIVSFITAGLLALYGMAQSQGMLEYSFAWSQNPQDRVFGTMGHSNHFGAYLGMCLLLGIGLFGLAKEEWKRWLIGGFSIIIAITILLTGSRGAFFATVIGLLISFTLLMIHKKKQITIFLKKHLKKLVVFALVLIMAFIIFAPQIKQIPLVERFNTSLTAFQQGQFPDRISWWLSSLQMIKDRPVLGTGISTFRDIYNNYRRLDYMVPGPGDLQYQITPESSHMEYLDIAVTQGIFGLVIYLALLVFLFWKMDKILLHQKKDEEKYYLTLAIKGALSVYLLQVLFSFGVVDTLTMFYLFLGAAASISQENISFTSIRLPCWIKNIATMIAVIILVVIGSFTLREAKAEWYYKNAIVENSEGKADNAQNSFEQVISEQPYQYEYYQAYGDFAFRIASSSQADLDKEMIANYLKLAIANYQKAIVLNPSHPSTLYNLGLASMQLSLNLQNDFYLQQGMNALKKSIELGVNNPLYPYQAGKIFLQIGRKDLAQEAFEIVMKIKPDYQDIQLLLQKK